MANPTVLIVDDEEEAVDVLADFLTDIGYTPTTALNGEEALHRLKERSFDLVIVDLRMPRIDGEGVILYMGTHCAHIPIIVVTGYNDAGKTEERMQQLSVQAYIEKPIDLTVLEKHMRRILAAKK